MKFSIIVPVCNVAPYLRECLDSVLAQTFPDWECICVDDGSTDGSGAILDGYAAKDARFNVVHQANRGVSAARNSGLGLAKGDWVTFLDGDDFYRAGWLEEASAIIDEEDPDLLKMGWTRLDGDERGTGGETSRPGYRKHEDGKSIVDFIWGLIHSDRAAWSHFQRRGMARAYKFPEGVSYCEDAARLLAMAGDLGKVCVGRYDGYCYRIREDSSRSQSLPADERLAFFAAAESVSADDAHRKDLACYLWENLLAWDAWHAAGDISRDGEVRAAYLRVAERNGLSACDVKRHWRMPYLLYVHCGIAWPVHATRRMLKWLKSFS